MTTTTTTTDGREAAAHEYFALEPLSIAIVGNLESKPDPAVRADLIDRLADHEATRARLHTTAFGRDPIDDEGRDMAESLDHTAAMLRTIAATERAIATGQRRTPAADPRVENAAAQLLDELATERDHAVRAEVLEELYEIVEPIIGGQAAEAIATIADTHTALATRPPGLT